MQRILESLPMVLKHIGGDSTAVEPIVFAAWKRCVEGVLAENIVPVRLERDRLVAAVSSETWRRSVADLGPELAARINKALGAALVHYIDFRVDADVVDGHRRQLLSADGVDIKEGTIPRKGLKGLIASAEAIANEDLRRQFVAAAAASLARARSRSAEA